MKTWKDYGKEWLDTLVVAISVAMAFRAYFYEPFNIPTGSMQETLWGYHTVENVERGSWDRFPLSVLKWVWTGSRVVDFRAPASGTVRAVPRNDGFADVYVGTHSRPFKLPTDACRRLVGRVVRAGEPLWKGAIVTGDFILRDSRRLCPATSVGRTSVEAAVGDSRSGADVRRTASFRRARGISIVLKPWNVI